ncbi:unnamed protein product [Aphanomyces euteiches]|uniref:Uncharacterized protein n=1 Tax=Aphanomyces euteiches TaxID=100861 RepID=A0A6G0WIZ6_9STRA|nr:hypothetical protein Ae201684_014723 [Aphanomyces euteiches]KAH9078151.1 hypothetical protein Ae201684P_019249 [Aphanomyces euteiches]KAH9157975.1 hypothetical protein AeRB84_000213 [Aphanomyces euteiches]
MELIGVVAEYMADATSEVQDLIMEGQEEMLVEGDEGTPEESQEDKKSEAMGLRKMDLAVTLLAKEQQIRQLGQQLQDTKDKERALQEQVADLGGQIESHELQASRRRFKTTVEAVMSENRREKLRRREKAVAMNGWLSTLHQYRLIYVVGFVLVGYMIAFILRSTSRP